MLTENAISVNTKFYHHVQKYNMYHFLKFSSPEPFKKQTNPKTNQTKKQTTHDLPYFTVYKLTQYISQPQIYLKS